MNIVIPVLMGTEVRQFFLSGVASRLIDLGHNVYVIVKYNNTQLNNEIVNVEPRLKILPHIQKQVTASKFTYLHSAIDFWYESKNKRWYYSYKVKLPICKQMIYKLVKYLLDINIFNNLAIYLEKKWMNQINVHSLADLLSSNQINKVIVSTARFYYYPELLIACQELKIPVDVVYHSNKELFAQPRICFDYNNYGLWNNEMKDQFIEKYPKLKSKIDIIGNSHFSYLINNNHLLSKSEFCTLYKVPSQKCKVILYTAASLIVKNEYLIVDWISNFLKKGGIEYKIIVRKNPMDTTSAWDDFFNGRTDVTIQHPKWIMDHELGLHYTLASDLIEYSSLLTYSSFCINIPSTVSIESAIIKRPVINICFDFPEVEVLSNSRTIKEFWDAPFYEPLHKYDFILPAFNIDQLSDHLAKLTLGHFHFRDFWQCVESVLDGNENEIWTNKKIIDFILKQ